MADADKRQRPADQQRLLNVTSWSFKIATPPTYPNPISFKYLHFGKCSYVPINQLFIVFFYCLSCLFLHDYYSFFLSIFLSFFLSFHLSSFLSIFLSFFLSFCLLLFYLLFLLFCHEMSLLFWNVFVNVTEMNTVYRIKLSSLRFFFFYIEINYIIMISKHCMYLTKTSFSLRDQFLSRV